MELIFNNIKDYILVIDDKKTIQFCNDSLLDKLKYIKEDLLNFKISKILLEEFNLDKSESIAVYNKRGIILNFNVKSFDIKWDDKDCKILMLNEVNNKLYNIEDLEKILDNLPFLTWIKDLSGKYIYINQAYAEKFNITKEYIIGKTDLDLWPKEEAKMLRKEDIEIAKNKYKFTNKELLRVNNTRVWFYVFKSVELDENGDTKYVFGSARDITDYKRLEEEKKRLEKEKELELIRKEFFANMSHEFKTPLNIISSTAQLLDIYAKQSIGEKDNKNKIEFYSKLLKQNSYRLLRLINNIIDMTKIDSGYYNIELDNHDIVSIVEDIVTSSCNIIENKKISIIFDTNEEEKVIACDRDKIEKIVLNLISNAIKYNEDDIKVEVSLNISKDNIQILVKDNGIGISSKNIDNIFFPFSQIDKSLNRKSEGCGIGLSLVKSLVDLHEGEIKVKSELNKGSEFIIILPVKYLENKQYKEILNTTKMKKVERCTLEFSDIYSI